MGIKDKLFRWGLGHRLKRIPTGSDLVVTPDTIVIPLQFVKEPAVIPITFHTPSWFKVIRLVIEEVVVWILRKCKNGMT